MPKLYKNINTLKNKWLCLDETHKCNGSCDSLFSGPSLYPDPFPLNLNFTKSYSLLS